MDFSEHPVIKNLADTDPAILKHLSPVEVIVIEVCKKIVEDAAT